jgi:hypothetical protein
MTVEEILYGEIEPVKDQPEETASAPNGAKGAVSAPEAEQERPLSLLWTVITWNTGRK